MKKCAPFPVFALWLAITFPVFAQVKVGQLNMDLSGNVTGGYTADYGTEASDHGLSAGGSATLSGYYYDPDFLSFSILPFLNQSWANSDYQSIVNSSGVTASAGIFNGTNYPGSVAYSKTFNSNGNFGIPGLANYTTHGDSDTLSVGWSEHKENLPSISINAQEGSSNYSIYGQNSDITTNFHGLSGMINYMVAGFTLTGNYHYLETYLNAPGLLGGQEADLSRNHSSTYSFGVSHKLPFNGAFSVSAARSDLNSEYTGGTYRGTIDDFSSGLSFMPINHLSAGVQAVYTDNLLGTIYAPILSAGGVLTPSLNDQSSHSLDVLGYSNYLVPDWHMTFSVTDDHRNQTIFGEALESNIISGTMSYSNELWGGFLNLTGGVNHSTVEPGNSSAIGFLGVANYNRNVRQWKVSVSGNYTQNAQTLLITYTTNNYGYSGSVGRKYGRRTYWSVMTSGSKTGIVGQSGGGSFSQAYMTSAVWRKVTGTAGFNRSSGNGVLTANGITSVTSLLPVISPTSAILYGGTSYSASISANPYRGLSLSASYAHSISSTAFDSTNSDNRNQQFNARVTYLIRKISFQAGFLRFSQGFSQSGIAPVELNSVYVGLMRWFNFF